MRMRSHSLVLLFVLTLASLPCRAGTQNAKLTGTVYAAGTVVPGATVRLINANIGFSQMQTTGPDGSYTFIDVPPAENYLISVEKSGFATKVLPPFAVQVGDDTLVLPPFLLEPAAPSGPEVTPAPQAARPTPAAPTVSLDLLSTTQSGVIDTLRVHTLPLVNRDFIDLALLVPGTYPVEQGSILQGASLVVNVARADMNNFLLDGADNNDYTINQSLPFQIVEALQEFRVQASTSNAEFGRSGGAQVNSVSRSGSNSFHGTLFAFNRNSALAAGNFFSGYSGTTFDYYARELQLLGDGNALANPTLAALYDQRKPRVNQNQFGGNVGGPLMKDKLFGFFNWESFRLANPRPLFEQVPGLPLRFPDSCASFLQQSASPPSSTPIPCFPATLALFNLYPQPNVPATPFTNPNSFLVSGAGAFNIAQSPNFTNTDNFLERVDLRVNSRTSMSFKHNLQRINQLQSGDVPPNQNYPGNGTLVNGRNQNVSFNFVELLTPRTTNEFRFGWNRFRLTTTAQDSSFNPSTLGFQNLNFDNQGLPTITVGGVFTTAQFSALGSNFITPSNRADNVWSFADNISLNRGRHTWKFGGEFRYIRLNVNNDALARGLLTLFSAPIGAEFGNANIASVARVCPPTLPSFATVFAQPCSQFGTGFARHLKTESFNGYVQDQWRPRSNLTFNYGIRYEVNTAPVELHNLLVNYYPSLATDDGFGGLVQGGSKTIFDPFGNVIGTAPQAAPRAGFKTDFNNWSPRFGFAWNPLNDGKTVLRGGYALVFDQQSLQSSVNMLLNAPFVQQDFAFYSYPALQDTFSVCGPAFISNNGCRSLSSNPGSLSTWSLFPYSITATDPNNRTPYVHQYHLGVQQRMGSKAVIEVAYVGSAGHRLALLRAISQCPTPNNPIACLAANPSGQFVTPFMVPSILDQENGANSNFNSLQVHVETKNFHGLQLGGFYQYAKSIDDSSSLQPQIFLTSPTVASLLVAARIDNPDNFAGANNISPTLSLQGNLPLITTRPSLPQDSNNLAGERARSDFDIRHRFVLNYVYAVPRFAPVIGSGWQLAGITTAQSGQPFTVYADFFGQPFRPNVVGSAPVPINMSNPQGAIDNGIPAGFPASSFSFAPTFQLQPGALGRNFFTGPKLINFDFAVLKDTRLSKREGANLQFRVEFFNLFNNVNFRQPYSRTGLFFTDASSAFADSFSNLCRLTNIGNTTCFLPDPFFGQILQAFPARQIQLALKLSF
jgi:Carboxypeptidase regulatory-like domain/TonB dependent receptor